MLLTGLFDLAVDALVEDREREKLEWVSLCEAGPGNGFGAALGVTSSRYCSVAFDALVAYLSPLPL